MTLYCVTHRFFPTEEIKVMLNGTHLTHRVAPLEGNWVSLETEIGFQAAVPPVQNSKTISRDMPVLDSATILQLEESMGE